MESVFSSLLVPLWLGILTSISPCPLATNIAAISFIGKRVDNVRAVILSGLVYTFGRMIAYIAVGAIVVGGLLSIPSVSNFLQRYMIMVIGPILVVTGMFLLELITVNLRGITNSSSAQKLAEKGGMLGAGLLGILFALSFCPVSAALFFGSLIPLSVNNSSALLMPSLFGLGTGLPVLGFAVLIAMGAHSMGNIFNALTVFECWARKITGGIFIATGVYLTLRYVFQIL